MDLNGFFAVMWEMAEGNWSDRCKSSAVSGGGRRHCETLLKHATLRQSNPADILKNLFFSKVLYGESRQPTEY